MTTCNKKIKHGMRDMGIMYSTICNKPSYIDANGKNHGLCHGHYNKLQKKLVNWIDRKEYRQATEQDLLEGRSLKLSNTHTNKLYQVIKGQVYEWHNGGYNLITDIKLDPTLFSVKIL